MIGLSFSGPYATQVDQTYTFPALEALAADQRTTHATRGVFKRCFDCRALVIRAVVGPWSVENLDPVPVDSVDLLTAKYRKHKCHG